MKVYVLLSFLLIGVQSASIGDVKKIEAAKPCKEESKPLVDIVKEPQIVNSNNNELRLEVVGKEIHIPVRIISEPVPILKASNEKPEISNVQSEASDEKPELSNEVIPPDQIKIEDVKPEVSAIEPINEEKPADTPTQAPAEPTQAPASTVAQGLLQSVQQLQATFQQGLQSIGQSIYSFFFRDSADSNTLSATKIQENIAYVQKEFEASVRQVRERLQNYIAQNSESSNIAPVETLNTGLNNIEQGVQKNLKYISQGLEVLALERADKETPQTPNIPFVPENIQTSIQNNIQQNFPNIPGQANLNNITSNIPNIPGQDGNQPWNQIPGISNVGNIQNPLGGSNQVSNQQNQQTQGQYPWSQWLGQNQASSTGSSTEQPPWQNWWGGFWQNAQNNMTSWNQNFQNWWQNNGQSSGTQSDEQPQRPGFVQSIQQFAQNIFGGGQQGNAQADEPVTRPPGFLAQGIQNIQHFFNRPPIQNTEPLVGQSQEAQAQDAATQVPTPQPQPQPQPQRNPIVQGIQNVVQRVQSVVRPSDEPRKKWHHGGQTNRDNNDSAGQIDVKNEAIDNQEPESPKPEAAQSQDGVKTEEKKQE